MRKFGLIWSVGSLTIVLLAAAALVGCNVLRTPVTPTAIFVTATAIAELPTPVPTTGPPPTDVIAPIATALSGSAPSRTPLPSQLPTLTPSFTLTFTDSPVPTYKAQACKTSPQGGFATIYKKDPALQQALGCAASIAMPTTSAIENFDGGRMFYASQVADLTNKVIYVAYNGGTYQRYDDTWVENVDPAASSDSPPPGHFAPARGFGKVWRNNPPVKSGLGWALNLEVGTGAEIERFDRGEMLFVAALNQTFVFIGNKNWRLEQTPY